MYSKKIILVVFIFVVLLTTCSHMEINTNQNHDSTYKKIIIKDFNSIYSLKTIWHFKFYQTDDMMPSLYDYDDADWFCVQLPHLWTKKNKMSHYYDPDTKSTITKQKLNEIIAGRDTLAWYRLEVDIPKQTPENTMGIRLGKIDNLEQVYFNGILIGETGKIFSSKRYFGYDKERIYKIPNNVIKPGRNVISILVKGYFTHGVGSGLENGPFLIGPFDKLYSKLTISEYIKLSIIAIFLVFGIYYLILFFYQRNTSEHVFFGMLCLLFGIYIFCRNQIKYDIFGIEYFIFLKRIEYIILLLFAPFHIHFVISFFKIKKCRYICKFCDLITLPGILVLLLFPHPYIWDYIYRFFYMYLQAFSLVYLLTSVIYFITKNNKEALYLIIGGFVLAIVIVNDNLTNMNIINTPRIFQWGFLFFILEIAFIMASRFQRLHNQTITTNENLNFLYKYCLQIYSNSHENSNDTIDSEFSIEQIQTKLNLTTELSCKIVHAHIAILYTIDYSKMTLIKRYTYIVDTHKNNKKVIQIINHDKSPDINCVLNTDKPDFFYEYSDSTNFVSFLCPLIVRKMIFGCVVLIRLEKTSEYIKNDLTLLSAFYASVSITLEKDTLNKNLIKKERIEKEKIKEENILLYNELQIFKREYSLDIVAESSEMIEIISFIKEIKDVDTTILITGESGVGKEIIAKALHTNSKRKDNPFIAINCAAIPHGLLESEFFGYEKGSFTGANNTHIGKFQAADGGTIFLDEIGDMDTTIQSKLLRVIQDRKIVRIGGKKEITVDIRIICATNKNIEDMVENNLFRADLFYRINIITIDIPALRKRKDDIIPLFIFFIKKYSYILNRPVFDLTTDVSKLLVQYEWPGNVRELENVVHRIMVVKKNGPISLEDIPDKIFGKIKENNGEFNREKIINALSNNKKIKLKENILEYEKQIIEKVFKLCNNNQRKTAAALSITLSGLQYKLNKYNIK